MIEKPQKHKHGLYGNAIQDRVFDEWEIYIAQLNKQHAVTKEGHKIAVEHMTKVLDGMKQKHAIEVLEARIGENKFYTNCPSAKITNAAAEHCISTLTRQREELLK